MTPVVASRAASPTVDIRADVSPEQWDEYVDQRSDASVYHRSGWAKVIERSFGHRTRYLAAQSDDRVVGILPLVFFKTSLFGRFATSMPFVNYGGIVADSSAVADALLAAAIDETQASGASYLELRHTRRLFPGLPVLTHKVEMVLPLQATVDDQWRVLDRKLRNQVRKAEKSALTVRVGGAELLGAFYDVLAQNMRDLGSPVHSRRLFENVLETFHDRSKIFCVSTGSTPIAASFVVWHGDEIEVPWASAVRAYNPLCPNVLLYWEMLKFGIEHGFSKFDFGRSTPNEGTYQFKQQWGAEPHQLYWEYWLREGRTLPDRSPTNPKFSSAIAAWQRMPVALTRIVGPFIVRNIP